jgi:DNA polymerase III epsilon subunit-like protein
MILLDIETSGVDFEKCGVWQIGAIDLETRDEFFEEGRIDEEDKIINSIQVKKPVLETIGKTEDELRNISKQSQKELISNFFNWVKNKKIQACICHNPQFDVSFILHKARKYGLKPEIHYKALDLHSIALMKYFEKEGKLDISIEKKRFGLGLPEILEFCGMKDNRDTHNALEDARLTAECFNRLMYGKNLFPEYTKFEIPEYLKK